MLIGQRLGLPIRIRSLAVPRAEHVSRPSCGARKPTVVGSTQADRRAEQAERPSCGARRTTVVRSTQPDRRGEHATRPSCGQAELQVDGDAACDAASVSTSRLVVVVLVAVALLVAGVSITEGARAAVGLLRLSARADLRRRGGDAGPPAQELKVPSRGLRRSTYCRAEHAERPSCGEPPVLLK